ncbi:methionine ABC transporter permease [Propionimicrobium lymphophilum]|uniref:methionine ABC transporter permease n=1 Tax=Propionimicrobium lymphophilum TaxID=33012 RepID=UPI003EC9038D
MTGEQMLSLLGQGTLDTLVMVLPSLVLATLLGLPLGVGAYLTAPGSLRPNPVVSKVLGAIIDMGRSLPFIIMLVIVTPLTKLLTGTSIGPIAAIVPLTIAAAPFVARLFETSLREVAKGKIDAGEVMGASLWQLIWHVLLPEALPSLVSNVTVLYVSLISYSAMAGAIGGGGLGDIAMRYGYQRNEWTITYIAVVILLVLTMGMQWVGDRCARALAHR